jgi:hypothetical protein
VELLVYTRSISRPSIVESIPNSCEVSGSGQGDE